MGTEFVVCCFQHHGFQLGVLAFLLILCSLASFISAFTDPDEANALLGLAGSWQNYPSNWQGQDPCGSNWVAIICNNGHITSLTLSALGINGTLSADIQGLVRLNTLDLSYNPGLSGPIPPELGHLRMLTRLVLSSCSFIGVIPPELGMLSQLNFLGLNSNKLGGTIPGALGYLSKLYWLDITDNQITGSIPVSGGINPGLDMLTSCRHFHLGNNSLNGTIPSALFHSELILYHLLLDNNKLSGSIPSTLGLVNSLTAVRLNNNFLTDNVPPSINDLTNIVELYLANNYLSGPLPNLTGLSNLAYLDMSNNSFDNSQVPPWFSTSSALTKLVLEGLNIAGKLPISLFSSPMKTMMLRNNRFNGTLDLGPNFSPQLSLIDLQSNDIQSVRSQGYTQTLILTGNPYCQQGGLETYCTGQPPNDIPYSTPRVGCRSTQCPGSQQMSPFCFCSYPFEGTVYMRLLLKPDDNNVSYYNYLENYFLKVVNTQVHINSVGIREPHKNGNGYFQFYVQIFPYRKVEFTDSDIIAITQLINNDNFTDLGPYYFIAAPYHFARAAEPGTKSRNWPVIIGPAVGGAILVMLVIGLLIFTLKRRRKIENHSEGKPTEPSGAWGQGISKSSNDILALRGPRLFTFEEVRKCTNNFSEENGLGSGGYGKVYRGSLPDGQLVAVKRGGNESSQGNEEFMTEIQTLSRINHRNVVRLIGFCFEQDEQMLVYEFVPNGNLKASLTGKSGVRLDWKRRLWISLGAARGLTYLHELADPPIVHRDVKSNNILLDYHLNAKVSDFGLSKAMSEDKKGHVTTQVKGTMGYLDPEYYMTQQLTEKSDVYSFGVLMLEIVTARKPIERGRYIVREVRLAIDRSKDLYGLHELLDPAIGLSTILPGFERFIDMAIKCVEESSNDRPSMSEVTKELENIAILMGINITDGSVVNSSSFGSMSRSHPYNSGSFDYSGGGQFGGKVEPK